MAKIAEVRLTLAAIMYATEIDLKNLITKYIVPYHQDLEFIGSTELIERTVKRFKKDNSSVNVSDNIDEVIEYLDFADFYKIILSKKTFFPDDIALDIKNSLNILDKMSSIRNRVMHTRPLLNEDFPSAYAFAKEKQLENKEFWSTLNSTLYKIEEDPSYVFTLNVPVLNNSDNEAYHNLPIPDFDETGFIGRKTDVSDILKLILGNNRVVSIIGDGGIGKSALALKVAYDILDLKEKNPFDVVIWVSAKTTMLTAQGIKDIENTLMGYGGVIQVLNEFIDEPKTKVDSLSNIIEYLEVFNVLLIVDNLETILDNRIREFIREASQKCKILITSRIGLGELEFRRPLSGLSDKESILLIRLLANLKQSDVLNKLDNSRLIDISKKLHFNPLGLKWFVNSVETGFSPFEVLSNTDNLLNFCLSNVYDKLSKEAILIVETILAARKSLNDAELVFTTEFPAISLRRTINELFATTFISREIEHAGGEQDLRYFIPDFAREYILRNHPIQGVFIKKITSRLKMLNISTANTKRISGYNEFGINAISIRNSNEKVVARLLNEALKLSKQEDVSLALDKIAEAKSILPNYFEVYRVSAFIKATYDDVLGAESDYLTGLEIEPDNPRLLFFYGSFLLYSINDTEKALFYSKKVFELRPNSEYPTFLHARILSTSGDFQKAISILTDLIANTNLTKTNLRITNTDLISVYSYWGKAIVDKEGDYQKSIDKFIKGIAIFENCIDARNFDARMIKTFCNIIKSFIKCIPRINNEENIECIKDLLIKYEDQISLNQSKDYLYSLFENAYKTKITNTPNHLGDIVSVNQEKFFAFIRNINGKEYYAHMKAFKFRSDFQVLKIGMKVNYDIGKNKIGECAVNISVNII